MQFICLVFPVKVDPEVFLQLSMINTLPSNTCTQVLLYNLQFLKMWSIYSIQETFECASAYTSNDPCSWYASVCFYWQCIEYKTVQQAFSGLEDQFLNEKIILVVTLYPPCMSSLMCYNLHMIWLRVENVLIYCSFNMSYLYWVIDICCQ